LLAGAALLAAARPLKALAAEPVRVGVLVPLSGGAGVQGQHMATAITAMADLINARGGVLGRPIEVLARDDEGTPAVGVAKANELIEQRVSAIIEGWSSAVTLAIQPIIARAGILDITAMAKADAILASRANPLAIRINSSVGLDSAATANYLSRVRKAKRIAFLTQNDAFGKPAQKALEDMLAGQGWTYEAVNTQLFPFAQTDFRIALTSIKDSNPDAVVIYNANESAGLPALIQQYRQMQIPAQLVASVGSLTQSVLDITGPAANGIVCGDIYLPDVEPFISNDQSQALAKMLKDKNRLEVDKYMAIAATALQVWAIVANAEKTLDREKIARAIRGHSIPGTIFGDAVFSEDGQLQHRYFDYSVTAGKMTVIKS
jgi:branched-chain amino acid transport system substrate-binding protein